MKDLAMHILDIVGNSIRAGASRICIGIRESVKKNRMVLQITDNGKGMGPKLLAQADDPFTTTRTTRKVGLGLPLLKQSALGTGGTFHLSSEPGKGTTVEAVFVLDHLDRPPAGNMGQAIKLLVAGTPDIQWVYIHSTDSGEYRFDSKEIEAQLGLKALTQPQIGKAIEEMINTNLEAIRVV